MPSTSSSLPKEIDLVPLVALQEKVREAKDYAFNLLTYRARSSKELNDRLKKKGYEEWVIREVTDNLKDLNFLNDEEFARSWAEERMATKPMGRRMLEQELRHKGIDEDIIRGVTEDTYARQGEEEIALSLARKRLKGFSDLDGRTKRRRLYSCLGRRGFSSETISETLQKVLKIKGISE